MMSKLKKIAIFSTTRAEFGILSALLDEIEQSENLEYLLFIGGTHLSSKYGNSISEIEKNYRIKDTFDYMSDEDDQYSIANSIGIAISQISNIFRKYDFDFVLVLGDRFELLSIVSVSIIYSKPIIHLHGGEVTLGAIDEQIRHMVTKSAHIHFAACEEYRQNIIRLGESSWRVHNTGALACDNMTKINLIDKNKLFSTLGLDIDKKTILLTYHPVTIENEICPEKQIENLLQALISFNFQVVITGPNNDFNREKILATTMKYCNKHNDFHFFESLGKINYLNLLPHCEFVIGNSSSGLIEVPYYRIPTINVGDRQLGRIRHDSVIDTNYDTTSIINGINLAVSKYFKDSLKKMFYKFGGGSAAKKMIEIIYKTEINQNLLRKKLDFGE